MSRSPFTSWAALLSTLVPLGCFGARTTLDQEDYLQDGEVSGSSGTTSGGSAAGGQGATAGGAGVVTGGSDPGGMTGVGGTGIAGAGGTVSVGGVAGVAGMGGKGGTSSEMKAACEAFCGPYSAACPDEAGTPGECTLTCLTDFSEGRRKCRDYTIAALNCLAPNLDPSLGCDEALVNGLNACFDIVQVAQECNEMAAACPGSFANSDVDCSSTLMCPEGYYNIYCYRVDQTQTSCNCTSDIGNNTSFITDVPVQSACTYATELCGFPSQ
jgi:hypothetical protein